MLTGQKWPFPAKALNEKRPLAGLRAWEAKAGDIAAGAGLPHSRGANFTNVADITWPRYDASFDGLHYSATVLLAQAVDLLADLCGRDWDLADVGK